jgi:hypothetical protein
MDDTEEVDLKTFVSGQMFLLRGALPPIVGNGQFLKAYLEAQQQPDSSLNVTLTFGAGVLEITPQTALQMLETILKCAQQINEIQEALRQKASGAS